MIIITRLYDSGLSVFEFDSTNSLKVNNFEMKILIFCRATLLIIHAAAVRTSGRRRWTRIERVQSNLLVRFSERTFDLATGDFD